MRKRSLFRIMPRHSLFRRWKVVLFGIFLFLLAAVLASELFLRFYWGLGSPPLFIAHPTIGYCYAANQNLRRWGNQVSYNQYHQRSEPLQPQPSYRILMLGDSLLNGGSLCDQPNTISEQWEKQLAQETWGWLSNVGNLPPVSEVLNTSVPEVLNASAASWGIANEWEYLRCFGTFQSNGVVLMIGTHDLTQEKSTSQVLGSRDYPTAGFVTAWEEVLSRYVGRKSYSPRPANSAASPVPSASPAVTLPALPEYKQAILQNNLVLLQEMQAFLESQQIPFLIVRIPEQSELLVRASEPDSLPPSETPQPEVNPPGTEGPSAHAMNSPRSEVVLFRAWIAQQKIAYLDLGMPETPLRPCHFYDRIHLNAAGNACVAQQIHCTWSSLLRKP